MDTEDNMDAFQMHFVSQRSHWYGILEKTKYTGRTNRWLPGGWSGEKSLTAKGQQEESFSGKGTTPYG